MYPFRFSLATLNLWNSILWEVRAPAVKRFLELYRPDICCFQEVREKTLQDIDLFLPMYDRIDDPLPGWNNEGTIYFNRNLFEEIEHGEVELDMPEKDRRMFWVRLSVRHSPLTLLVANVHLTHQENADECATGLSYRHAQAEKMGIALDSLERPDEPVLVCGDFNDPVHPARQLKGHGFVELFNSLGLAQPPTFPCAAMTDEIHVTEAIDKILSKGNIRALQGSVPNFYHERAGLSDHWPVVATFSMEDANETT